MTVFLSKFRHRRYTVKCHIFNPFRHFPDCSASQVSINVCFTSKLTAEFKIFVGSEAVVFHHASPVCVDHLFSCIHRTYPIHPVILVRKTSAGPPEYRNTYPFQRFDYIGSHSVHIFYGRILSHINTFVNTSSEMLGKMSVYFSADPAQFPVWIDHHSRHFKFLPLLVHTA